MTDANIDTQDENQDIIACGVWVSSNQTPYNMMINPKTSRNLGPGDKLSLIVNQQGITTGNGLVRIMICAHVTRK